MEMEYAEEGVDETEQDADADDRTYEEDNKEHYETKESDQEDAAGDEEGEDEAPLEEEPIKVVIDVPKRMRKDVDEADVEDGEVFDDDEELHGQEGKTDGTTGEFKARNLIWVIRSLLYPGLRLWGCGHFNCHVWDITYCNSIFGTICTLYPCRVFQG